MTIPFTCPHCGHHTIVAPEYAGQSGPCAGCGKPVTIPNAGLDMPASPASDRRPQADVPSLLVMAVLAIVTVVGMLLVGAILLVFLVPATPTVAVRGRLSPCEANLRRIAMAMQRYHEAHGYYPPAYLADENGQPMHSWRVLLLPYLGHEALLQQYDMTQPWDSPQNLWLADRMPQVYGCPDDPDRVYGETSYMVVTGPGTLFEAGKKSSAADVTDGLSKTILVVESTGSGTSWTAPVDLPLDKIPFSINAARPGGVRSAHASGGAHVATADGAVYRLPDHLSPDAIRALITPRGGEVVGPAELTQN
jgi:hypothetical protein